MDFSADQFWTMLISLHNRQLRRYSIFSLRGKRAVLDTRELRSAKSHGI